jgi:ligand-binding sensor domain-containing protein
LKLLSIFSVCIILLIVILNCSDDNINNVTTGGGKGKSFWYRTNAPFLQATVLAADKQDFIYAFFPDSGLFISKDNGFNWQPVSMPPADIAVMMVTTNGDVISGGTGRNIYVSGDNGSSWTAHTFTESETIINAIYQSADGRVLIGAASGVFVSDSTLTNWTTLNNGLSDDTAINFVQNNDQQFLAATKNHGIYSFNMSDSIWQQNNWGLTSNKLSVLDKDENGFLYAGTTDKGVFKSIEGGAYWNAVDNGLPPYVNCMIINQDSYVFAGTSNGVYRLNAGASMWNALNEGVSSKIIRDLAINSKGYVFMAADSGIYRSNTSTLQEPPD